MQKRRTSNTSAKSAGPRPRTLFVRKQGGTRVVSVGKLFPPEWEKVSILEIPTISDDTDVKCFLIKPVKE